MVVSVVAMALTRNESVLRAHKTTLVGAETVGCWNAFATERTFRRNRAQRKMDKAVLDGYTVV